MPQPTVFISYSHRDEAWKDRVVRQLRVLENVGTLSIWDDRDIHAGDDWESMIGAAIDRATIAILLLTDGFLASEFLSKREVPQLLRRREREGLRIVPLVIGRFDLKGVAWLRGIQCRPKDAQPLSELSSQDADRALAEFAKEIRLLVTGAVQREAAPSFEVPPETSISRLAVTGGILIGRERELDLLDGAWLDSETNLISLVAFGGAGKSALVNEWLERLRDKGWGGAERVFGWSFAGQGAAGGPAESSDLFIDEALRWFGDEEPAAGNPWQKGERLAKLVRQSRTLLVLDGLESLQGAPSPGARARELTDPALATLLRELAYQNSGLCVITTRVESSEIAQHRATTAPVMELERLSPSAGSRLLSELGVKGSDEDRLAACEAFAGHALTLTLLGAYLSEVHDGDAGRWRELALLEEDEEQTGHAHRVMRSYERWMVGRRGAWQRLSDLLLRRPARERGKGAVSWSFLRLTGLFDRPASGDEIRALLEEPAIRGLTHYLTALDAGERKRVLAYLRRLRLLAQPDGAVEAMEAHPLVRAYMARQLQERLPDAWRQGHRRLFEHYQRTLGPPATLEKLVALLQAVGHGCLAGMHQAAAEFWFRGQYMQFVPTAKSEGSEAIGAELAALAGFFERPFDRLVAGLDSPASAWLLNRAGWCLASRGRLAESVRPYEAGLRLTEEQGEWDKAVINACLLSELHLTLGEIGESVRWAERAVELADLVEDDHRIFARTDLADALHQQGDLTAALRWFTQAEQLQEDLHPRSPRFTALAAFQYCNLLLGDCETVGRREAPTGRGAEADELRERFDQARRRASRAVEVAESHNETLNVALSHLTLGRADLCEELSVFAASQAGSPDLLTRAEKHLDLAVAGLREAGQSDYQPHGLIARASLRRHQRRWDEGLRDLGQALDIASRGPMRLFETDALLERARLHRDRGEMRRAADDLHDARTLIDKCGYHRRDPEVALLERQLPRGS